MPAALDFPASINRQNVGQAFTGVVFIQEREAMKSKVIRAALAASTLFAALLTSAEAEKKKTENELAPSPPVFKILGAVQKLVAQNDYKTALDQLHAAQALPNRTPDDDYLINGFLASVSIRLNDMADATTAFEAMADSPILQKDPNKVQVLGNAMIVEDVSKKYQKTIAYAQMLQAIQPLDAKQSQSLIEAYYFTNDFVHVKQLAQKVVADSKAAGTIPPQGILQMLMNSDLSTGDKAGGEAASEELAVDYNIPSDWARLIQIYSNLKGQPIDALNLLRLGVVTGAALDASDYTLMGSVASHAGFFGDAEVAARHGGKVPGAAAKAAADQKELPGLIAAAKSQDSRHNIVLAEDVYGYSRYTDAEALAKRALSTGGPADEANMLIGMSLAGQGKYSDAVAAFAQVKGTPEGAKAAHLWTLYAQRKAAPPVAATATTQTSTPASH